ncbi:MAG: hypothetical protein IJN13_00340 [Bacilli bacterium]|nr:hypothetical protein [Bacilli bacterium]
MTKKIIICLILIIILVLNLKQCNNTKYEFAINGIIKTSTKCYQDNDQQCYCLYSDEYIEVDNYYVDE